MRAVQILARASARLASPTTSRLAPVFNGPARRQCGAGRGGIFLAGLAAAALAVSACPADPTADPFPTVTFPPGFAFGTAIAQWQVEGDEGANGPVDSNWSRWMGMNRAVAGQQNPDGNGFRRHHVEDIRRAKALGLDTFRLGLDWSRVEPEPGVYNDAELDHFVAVLEAIVAEGMKPVVTFWHWTVPTWVQQPDPNAPGGKVDLMATKDRAVVDAFADYVRHVVPRIKGHVDTYTVLNEPFSMIVLGYIEGRFPPGELLQIERATDFGINLLFMHAAAYDAISELDDVDADGDGQPAFIGLTMTANEFVPSDAGNPQQEKSVASINYVFNDWFIRALVDGELDTNFDGLVDDATTTPPERIYNELKGRLDFIGVQYYGPGKVTDEGILASLVRDIAPLYAAPLLDVETYTNATDQLLPHNGMGREISAAGFRVTLDRYQRWGLPMIITENGTTTNGRPHGAEDLRVGDPLPALELLDDQAAMFMVEHLWELGRAVADGLDVRGYYHWTIADNYEWVEGKLQRFGAYSVDFSDPNYPRTLNKQGEALRDVATARAVNGDIAARWLLPRYPTDRREGGLDTVRTTTSEPLVPATD